LEYILREEGMRPLLLLASFVFGFCHAQTIDWVNNLDSGDWSTRYFQVKDKIFLGPGVTTLPSPATTTDCAYMWFMGTRAKKDFTPLAQTFLPGADAFLADHGNYYTGGAVLSRTFCGTGSFSVAVTPTVNHQSSYVTNYDSTGALRWVAVISAPAEFAFNSTGKILSDAQGNIFALIYLAGERGGTLGFRIAKYDLTGHLLWVTPPSAIKSLGSDLGVDATMACDRSGNCYVTGRYLGDSLVIGQSTLNSDQEGDNFLAKFDPDGQVVWVKGIGTPNDLITCIDVRGDRIALGCEVFPFGASSVTVSCNVMLLDTAGKTKWTSTLFHRPSFPGNLLVSLHPGGDVYVVASYREKVSYIIDTTTYFLSTPSDQEEVLARFSKFGSLRWLTSSSTSIYQSVAFDHLQCDDDGSIYIAGGGPSASFMGDTIRNNVVIKLNPPGRSSGIQENLKIAVKLVPNPTAGHLTLLGLENLSGDTEVSIISSSGALVKRETFRNGQLHELSVENLTQGIYTVTARNGSTSWHSKFAKE
jgi:hypothetical protein